jgi:preprotein translocase subunit SecF
MFFMVLLERAFKHSNRRFRVKLEKKLDKRYQEVYDNHQKYFLIPVVLVVLGIALLGVNYVQTGQFLEKGTDFAGGTQAEYRLQGDFSTTEVEQLFANNGLGGTNAVTQSTSEGDTLLLEIPVGSGEEVEESRVTQILNQNGYSAELLQFNSISAAVSQQFFLQAQIAFVLAFTVMSLVIFIAFKDITPSIAVIFAAAGDIIIAAAGMAVLGIPLTLGSLAALLMLIGYSVDTDIVLSTRSLRNERGSLRDRMWKSLKTGVTMSSGGILGFTLLYAVSYVIVGPSELSNIAAVMVIGLLADMPLTWLGNTAILKSYIEREKLIGDII